MLRLVAAVSLQGKAPKAIINRGKFSFATPSVIKEIINNPE